MVHNREPTFEKNLQYYKFCLYGFLKNLRFFDPFLILFFLEKGMSYLQIGTLYAIREIVRNILEIPAGILADALGRRKTMITSFSFYIISFLIFYFSETYWMFVVAMLVFSFGDAFRTGTHKAMIFEYLKIKGWQDQKVYYYGGTRSCSQLGSAISSLLAAGIVFYRGSYQSIFLFTVIPYVLDLLLMMSYPKALDGSTRAISRKEIKGTFKKVIGEFIYSFKTPRILQSISNLSVFSGFHKAVKDYLQPVLQTFALSTPFFLGLQGRERSALLVGIMYFIIYLMTSYSSRRSGYIANRFNNLRNPLNITILSGLIIGMLTGVFYQIEIFWLSIILFVLVYLVENARKPMGISYVSDLFEQNILATALSAESQIKSFYAAIFALLLGFFADQWGVGYALMIVPGIALMLSPLFYLKEKGSLNNDRKRSKN
ncbi:MAG: MFS transporter [Bacteroidales bacterium]|nr:MFS transporter [Bacteroidales bacterium]